MIASGRVRMLTKWAMVALISLLFVAALGAVRPGSAQQETLQDGGSGLGLTPGSPAPDAQVTDLEGKPVSLLELVGDGPAVIEFWASWCENCEALQPQLDEIHERFGEQVKVVAVAVAVAQSLRRVRRHVERHTPGYPYVYDISGEAVRAYQAPTTSVVVLIDADRKVVLTGVGPDQELIGAVETLLEGAN